MKLKMLISIVFTALLAIPFAVSAELVNINNASAEAMSHHLKGIGSVKAQSIVDYRESNGDFKRIDDLLDVKGIGKGLLKNNKLKLSLTEGVVALAKTKRKPVSIDTKVSDDSKTKALTSEKLASKASKKPKVSKTKKKKVANKSDILASTPAKK